MGPPTAPMSPERLNPDNGGTTEDACKRTSGSRIDSDRAITTSTKFISMIPLLLSAGLLCVTCQQTQDLDRETQRLINRESRAKFVVSQIHIWNAGQGSMFTVDDNSVPIWKKDQPIEGVALATNVGGMSTDISGYCLAYWHDGPLTMFHPGWNAEPTKTYWHGFVLDKKAHYPENDAPYDTTIRPGTAAKCSITTKVQEGADLYIIGAINFTDSVGDRHGVLFARKYIETEKRFEIVKDVNYESSDYAEPKD